MGTKRKKSRKTKKAKPKKMVWYHHKGVRRNNKKLHRHPSHPYPHPMGRRHKYPPSSRIKDRKGKRFRGGNDRRHPRTPGSYKSRGGKRKNWD